MNAADCRRMFREARAYRQKLLARDWRGMYSEPREPSVGAVVQRQIMRDAAKLYARSRGWKIKDTAARAA